MKITLSIDAKESIVIGHMDLASIVSWLDDDVQHAFFYSRLAQHPASEVRSAIAGKASLPLDVLVGLEGDASIEVVRQLANNERALKLFELPLILKMISRDVSVADEIADNLYRVSKLVRVGVMQALLQHTDPKVAEKAENFACDADEFDCDEE